MYYLKKANWFWVILLLILLFSGFLRMYGLDKVPSHMGNDEISIAYDSYSIRVTGKDEYGIPLPLSFKSHRDYKSPLYAYLNVPFNLIFGNNEFGGRMLSAVVGTLMVLAIGLLGRSLLGDGGGIITALLLATNPKSIFVSRMGFEANLASGLILLGVLLMWILTKRKNWYWAAGAGLAFGLSVWAYHTPKGLAPLLMLFLPLMMPKKSSRSKWLLMWLLAGLLVAPIMYDFVFVQSKDPFNRASSQIWFRGREIEGVWKSDEGLIKKIAVTAVDPVFRYFDHFNLDLLFGSGLNILPKYEPLGQGWFLLIGLPLLIAGLFWSGKVLKNNQKWVLTWLFLSPIVPSLTSGEVASVRNFAVVIPLTLVMAAGGLVVWNYKKKLGMMILILGIINFGYFTIAYYGHFPIISADNFQYGYKQAWQEIKPIVEGYDRVIVEPRFGDHGQYVGLPRLYLGYFGAYDAVTMQNRDEGSNKIGKYEIRLVDWNRESVLKSSIYIVSVVNPTVNQANQSLELWKVIKKPDSKVQFLIYRN